MPAAAAAAAAFFSGLNVNNFLTAARQRRKKNRGLFLRHFSPSKQHVKEEGSPSAATFARCFLAVRDSTAAQPTAHCPGRVSNYSLPPEDRVFGAKEGRVGRGRATGASGAQISSDNARQLRGQVQR